MRLRLGICGLMILTACGGDDAAGTGGGGSSGTGGTAGQAGSGAAAGQAGTGGVAGAAGTGGACNADVQSDPDHCGTCGHSCQGGTCDAGMCQPVTLASGLAYPYRVAVDESDVYFTVVGTYKAELEQSLNGMVASVPKAGGAVSDLSQASIAAYGLGVDATNVYVSFLTQNYVDLIMFEKAGGEPVDLGSSSVTFMALDVPDASATASMIYYLDGYSVAAVEPGTGSVQLVTTSTPPSGIALAGSEVLFGDSGDWDPSTLMGPPVGNGMLMKVSTSGGSASALDENAGSPYAVAADATHAYYTDLFGHRVVRVALDGSSVEELATGQSYPYGVIVDDDYVYWTNRGGGYWEITASCGGLGSLMRAPKAGGDAEVLVDGLDCAGWLAQDEASLYWVEQGSLPYQSSGDGRIAKIAK